LGYACNELGQTDEALTAFRKARKIAPDEKGVLLGLSSCYTVMQDHERALRYADRVLAVDPENVQAHTNRAFALLHTGRLGEGWDCYSRGVGNMKWRDRHDYGLIDGIGGRTLFYAEQGIGDQMAFCSAIPDAIRDGRVAGINCHPKLANLFRDSFDVPVFGDQFTKEVGWIDDIGATHQAPMSALQARYRRTPEDYPGRPFLKTNAAKALQWRALLDSLGDKPKIGIAWTGGFVGSHSWRDRVVSLSYFDALRAEINAEWISMEYNDRSAEIKGSGVHDFPWGTQTADYSDAVAMVSALDAVVCVPTAVYHAAGSIGVPCWVLAHDTPHFHETLPYYGSVRHLKRRSLDFKKLSREILDEVQRDHPGRSGASRASQSRHAVRANGNALQHGAF